MLSRFVLSKLKTPVQTSQQFTKHIPTIQAITKIVEDAPIAISTRKNSTTAKSTPLVEMREYTLRPHLYPEYIHYTTRESQLRTEFLPLRMMSAIETGGMLNRVSHLYYYEGGHDERNARRQAIATNLNWREHLKVVKPCMVNQISNMYVEANTILDGFSEISGLSSISEPSESTDDCIIEIRKYKLKLGYDTVPQFLSLFSDGLPSKLNAEGTDPTTSLITVLYTEVGILNEVIEIWKHGRGTAAMEQSRVAARGANEWRKAVGEIASLATEFTTSIQKPLAFSPIS